MSSCTPGSSWPLRITTAMTQPGKRAALAGATLIAVGACSEPQVVKTADDEPTQAAQRAPRKRGGPSVQAEIGALDKVAVKKTISAVEGEIAKCLRGANTNLDMPIVGGDLRIALRIKGDGSLRYAIPTRSTFGDRGAERCVLSLLTDLEWPKPQGGDEGLAETGYGIDAPGRAPVAWSPSDLGKSKAAVMSDLVDCKSASTATRLSVTFYVDADGKVITAGGAVTDVESDDVIDCAVRKISGRRYPSPGSYPAKVTVTVP